LSPRPATLALFGGQHLASFVQAFLRSSELWTGDVNLRPDQDQRLATTEWATQCPLVVASEERTVDDGFHMNKQTFVKITLDPQT